MARYYFDLRSGNGLSKDEEGLELPDLAAEPEEAISTLADLAKDEVRSAALLGDACNFAVEVRDDSGTVIYARIRLDIGRLQ